jgi:type IV secretion system protein VirB9
MVAALMLPTALLAQVHPDPGGGDPRLQTVKYDADQIVQLRLAPGYQLTVEFSPDERVENIAVGDSGAWQITPNKRGDHIFVKALSSGVTTNMTVVTDSRTYVFELAPLFGPSPEMGYKLRFLYPASAKDPAAVTPTAPLGRYVVKGPRALRPAAMDDDGHQTHITWPPDQPLPAMFIIDANGLERPIDGAMRGGTFVIDGIANHFLFRLDRKSARATRVPKLKVRP